MSSANKVGELFKAAGHVLNQLGDLAIQIHLSADQPSPCKPRLKRRPRGVESVSNVSESKRFIVADQKPTLSDTSALDGGNRPTKNPKLAGREFRCAEVTLSALNSPELDADMEDLDSSSSPGKKIKLAYESEIDTSLL